MEMPETVREHVLIADDEPLFLRSTVELVRKAGYRCTGVANGNDALELLRREPVDVLIADLNMPGNLRLELLHEGRARHPNVAIIVITGVPTLDSAIDSVRLGISDYLLKPVKVEDLLQSICHVVGQRARIGARGTSESPGGLRGAVVTLGDCPRMQEVFRLVQRVGPTDTNVLITGESGTGKEVVAQAIHQFSQRSGGPFVPIDCAAIPEPLFESTLFGHMRGSFTGAVADQTGLLELCHRGTAFLDEIGEMPLTLQAKLLRVVQNEAFKRVGSTVELSVETRFVCATNRDLEREVEEGRFRRDLFYRLGVVHIALPPLRERGDDVLQLADQFLKELRGVNPGVRGFTDSARDFLVSYSWPGNVRELRNVVERGLVLTRGELIGLEDLPPAIRASQGRAEAAEPAPRRVRRSRLHVIGDAEVAYLEDLLRQCGGNVSQAAARAGITRQGLYKLLDKYGISAGDFRRDAT
jgi:two-component system response regulator HydG